MTMPTCPTHTSEPMPCRICGWLLQWGRPHHHDERTAMPITTTEIRYKFTITTKPEIDHGSWVGEGAIQFVDESMPFSFIVHRYGRTGVFDFAPGGDRAVESRVEAALLETLSRCYAYALDEARLRFGADLYDSGAGIVDA